MTRLAREPVLQTTPRRALDFSFIVHADDERVVAHLDDVLGSLPLAAASEPVHAYVLRGIGRRPHIVELLLDGELLETFVTPSAAVSYLLWHLNRQAIEASGRYLLVHAGAVARHGRVIVLPAPMESGKSTLVTALLRHGFDYLTDEAAAIDVGSGLVTPYPKAVHLDPGSWPLFPDLAPSTTDPSQRFVRGQWQLPPARMGAATAGAAPLGALVFPRYQPGASSALEPLGNAHAVAELIANSFNFADHGRAGLDGVGTLLAGIPCRRLTVGELDAACGLVMELVR